MGVYQIGDWLIDKQTKQLFEVVMIYAIPSHYELKAVNELNTVCFVPTERVYNEYNKLDARCPVARVLYSSNVTRR